MSNKQLILVICLLVITVVVGLICNNRAKVSEKPQGSIALKTCQLNTGIGIARMDGTPDKWTGYEVLDKYRVYDGDKLRVVSLPPGYYCVTIYDFELRFPVGAKIINLRAGDKKFVTHGCSSGGQV
jgi:hypothetical protein